MRASPPARIAERAGWLTFACSAAGDPLRRPSAVRSVGCVDGATFSAILSTGLFAMSVLRRARRAPRPVPAERA